MSDEMKRLNKMYGSYMYAINIYNVNNVNEAIPMDLDEFKDELILFHQMYKQVSFAEQQYNGINMVLSRSTMAKSNFMMRAHAKGKATELSQVLSLYGQYKDSFICTHHMNPEVVFQMGELT